MTSDLSNLEKVATGTEANTDDVINEELLEIEELDASIHILQLKIEEISNELTHLQIENREKLRQMLLSSPPECSSLARNTELFLNLHSNGSKEDLEKLCDSEEVFQRPKVAHGSEENSNSEEDDQELENPINDGSSVTALMKNFSNEETENCEEQNPFSLDHKSILTFSKE